MATQYFGGGGLQFFEAVCSFLRQFCSFLLQDYCCHSNEGNPLTENVHWDKDKTFKDSVAVPNSQSPLSLGRTMTLL